MSDTYPTVVALDPGGTTGWCVMSVHPEALTDPDVSIIDNVQFWSQGQFDGSEMDQAEKMCTLVELWEHAAVVTEDFILRIHSKSREVLAPVRLNAVLNYHLIKLEEEPRRMWTQQPHMAMSTATDDRLKAWKLYVPGEVHARDACRHAVTFFRRAKQNAPRLPKEAWPTIYE